MSRDRESPKFNLTWSRRSGALAVLAAEAAAVLLLGGCAPINLVDPDNPTAVARVKTTSRAVFTRSDPAACDRAFTTTAMAQIFGGTTGGSLDRCRNTIANGIPAASALVDEISINVVARSAKTRVTPIGGENDGLRLNLELERRAGRWRVDRVAEVEIVDPKAWREAQLEVLQMAGRPSSHAKCLVDEVFRVHPIEAIEDAWVKQGKGLISGILGPAVSSSCQN